MTSYALPEQLRDDDDDRRRRGLIWLWFAILVVLLAGLLTVIERLNGCGETTCGASSNSADGGSRTGDSQTVHSTTPQGASSSAVSINVTGSANGGLAPGATRPMVVSITNKGSKPARITTAGVSVGDASKTCSAASTIRVTTYSASAPGAASYDVAPGAAVRIPLTITMLDLPTNQNACKNALFPLTFYATAQQG
jgi:hypothetical protein